MIIKKPITRKKKFAVVLLVLAIWLLIVFSLAIYFSPVKPFTTKKRRLIQPPTTELHILESIEIPVVDTPIPAEDSSGQTEITKLEDVGTMITVHENKEWND